eukprot:TRINITY_DN2187_c2_g1_i2.p1 TRINITY_DN2187_c2_g1~~TRINITY_DN2187_c2_g1_i2.p1  ORF type:complete len:230 (+),score=36.04 TRINITY_DN2187_c2_g1_i2:83-772(+)
MSTPYMTVSAGLIMLLLLCYMAFLISESLVEEEKEKQTCPEVSWEEKVGMVGVGVAVFCVGFMLGRRGKRPIPVQEKPKKQENVRQCVPECEEKTVYIKQLQELADQLQEQLSRSEEYSEKISRSLGTVAKDLHESKTLLEARDERLGQLSSKLAYVTQHACSTTPPTCSCKWSPPTFTATISSLVHSKTQGPKKLHPRTPRTPDTVPSPHTSTPVPYPQSYSLPGTPR